MSEPNAPDPAAPEPVTPDPATPDPNAAEPAPVAKPPLGFGDSVGEGFGLGCVVLLLLAPAAAGLFVLGLANDVGAVGYLVGGVVVPAVVVTPLVLWMRRRGWFRLAQGLIVAAVIGVLLTDALIGGCWSMINS